MSTNAQAALQAAATVYGQTRAYYSPRIITGLADEFKAWLDKQDKATVVSEPSISQPHREPPYTTYVSYPEERNRPTPPLDGPLEGPPRPRTPLTGHPPHLP